MYYSAVQEMTYEEKFLMYNRLKKKELIAMLIEANNNLSSRQPTIVYPQYDFYTTSDITTVGDMCPCNPKNGGSGICNCTIANTPLQK